MFSFFKRSRSNATGPQSTTPEVPRVPDGERIYAVGDIHGCLALLERLLAAIAANNASREPAKTTLVMLGDLIDRGPDSRGVVERALRLGNEFDDVIILRGNHEQFLLDALVQPQAVWDGWLSHGGRQTLASYGIPERFALSDPARLAQALRREIPVGHLDLFEAMPLSWRRGDYFFAHAGVRPALALERQSPRDLLMIRGEFLESDADHGAVVVHGHSIGEQIEVRPNRIGLDTGAYRTGILSAIRLEGAEREFLTVSDPGGMGIDEPAPAIQALPGRREFLKQ
jgi:serine/threonine protein phosphatase 1